MIDWENASLALAEVQNAAKKGDADAQYNLGAMYVVPEDDKQAVPCFRKAAEQGDAQAQFTLGAMYDTGQGVAQDDQQAVAWYRYAAEQGHAMAQHNLGKLYLLGQGVERNYLLAYVWSSVAAANGYQYAVNNRDIAAKRLSPRVLAEAQALAGQYFEQYQPERNTLAAHCLKHQTS